MPSAPIRTSHLYLYDSTIGQSELARENDVHCKLIMKARSRVNTTSPKFWIPHVGSPLRLTRPHGGSSAGSKTKKSNNGPSSSGEAGDGQQEAPTGGGIQQGRIRPQSAALNRSVASNLNSHPERKQQRRPFSAAGSRNAAASNPSKLGNAFHHHSYSSQEFREGSLRASSGPSGRPQSAGPLGRGFANSNKYSASASYLSASDPAAGGGSSGYYGSTSTLNMTSGDDPQQQSHLPTTDEAGAEAAAGLAQVSGLSTPAQPGLVNGPSVAPSGTASATAYHQQVAGAAGVSPFRDRGIVSPPRRRSPHRRGHGGKSRQNYQQMAMQRALERQAVEEQQRREKFREEQTRGLTLMGSSKNNTSSTSQQHQEGGGKSEAAAGRSIPAEYGGGAAPPPLRGGVPQQHLTYHAEEVFHDHDGSGGSPPNRERNNVITSDTASANHQQRQQQNLAGPNISSITADIAASSPVRASELAAMRGHANGKGAGPANVQEMVEEFIDFCVHAFPRTPEGDDEVRRMLLHAQREIEERRLLALHRHGGGL